MSSIRLSQDEAWAEIAAAHTGVVTTLRRDGWPISLPVWFVVIDHAVFVRTPVGAKKVARIRRDERACFMVERGEQWAELCAVVMPCTAAIVDDPAIHAAVSTELDKKYAAFRVAATAMPDATKRHYAASAFVELTPSGKLLTWDNARIRLNQ